MSKATIDILGELHGELARALTQRIKDGECPASVLKEAREFLKDNGIEADLSNGPLNKLADTVTKLPFSPDDELTEAV